MNFYQSNVPTITPVALNERLKGASPPHLLDVRSQEEREIASIGGQLIPLQELAERLEELEAYKEREIVVYCRSGARSHRAVEYMRAFGFEHAINLEGGILGWREAIDPALPAY